MKSICRASEGRLRFSIRLTPRASRNEVLGWVESGELRVRVTSPPIDDEANQGLIRFLAKILEVKKSDITICAGAHSRTKQLEVPEACKNRLLSFDDI